MGKITQRYTGQCPDCLCDTLCDFKDHYWCSYCQWHSEMSPPLFDEENLEDEELDFEDEEELGKIMAQNFQAYETSEEAEEYN